VQTLCSYVIRVYRRSEDGVAGLIESVETGEAEQFQSAGELWTVLCALPSRRRSQPLDEIDKEEGP